MSIENEKIRIEGFKENFYCIKSANMCYSVLYTIEFQFKDNKIKFTPLELNYSVNNISIKLDNASDYYKNGEIRNMYKDLPKSIERLFNNLSSSLYSYLSEAKNIENDNW